MTTSQPAAAAAAAAAAAPLPPPQPPAAAAAGDDGTNGGFAPGCCCHCGDVCVLPEWRERLKLNVCQGCSRRREQLISKSTAKTVFLLSDGDLVQLGHLERKNPHHQQWQPMKQYAQSQVVALAVRKYGSLEAVEEERQARMRGKLDKRLQKRKAAEEQQQREEEREEQLQALLSAAPRTSAAAAAAAAAAEPHHAEDEVDPVTGKRLKRFGPGMAAVEVEEF